MKKNEYNQAEKEYLARTKSEQWELTKPFPFGNEYLPESLDFIWEFVTAVKNLQPKSTDVILDLGAGSCWVSEWLQRLNLKPVSIDISLDMLRVGKRRLPKHGYLVVGDSEALPFLTASVPRVLCVNSFHHMPNMRVALKEIHRVLRPDGFAVFCEPGIGHSQRSTSQIAMRDFGVLEQDIIVADFMELCSQVGFVDVQLKPTSYVVPGFGLSLEDWKAWRRFWVRKRPVRALQKLVRDFLEILGIGKRTYLLEETFAIHHIRRLKPFIEEHPLIAAYKTMRPSSEDEQIYKADIQIVRHSQNAGPGDQLNLTVIIGNQGNQTWPYIISTTTSFMQLGVQLLDSEKRLINRDFFRQPLKKQLNPGEREEMEISLAIPDNQLGAFYLLFDIVHEGVSWFEALGSTPSILHVEIINGKFRFSVLRSSYGK